MHLVGGTILQLQQLLCTRANRMVGGAHHVHDSLQSISGSNAIVNWSKEDEYEKVNYNYA